jgi:hypothetical protein
MNAQGTVKWIWEFASLAERRRPSPLCLAVETLVLPIYVVLAVPPSLVGVATVLAVIRANKEDLPAIVRALMRIGPRDDDDGKGPPSLPKP